MNYNSDEKDDDMASFFCVPCFTVTVLRIVSVLCVVSFYVYNQSACGKYISNTIT